MPIQPGQPVETNATWCATVGPVGDGWNSDPDFDTTGWKNAIDVPVRDPRTPTLHFIWANGDGTPSSSPAYFRRVFTLDSIDQSSLQALLDVAVHDDADVWVNGQRVIRSGPGGPLREKALLRGVAYDYRISQFQHLKKGRNLIAVKAYVGSSGEGGLHLLLKEEVNTLVTFAITGQPPHRVDDRMDCQAGAVGKFEFQAILTNIKRNTSRDRDLRNLLVQIDQADNFTGSNQLLLNDKSRKGNGDWFHVPRDGGFADGLLSPGESVIVPFIVCLGSFNSFPLVVDVLDVSAERRGLERSMGHCHTGMTPTSATLSSEGGALSL